MDQYINLLLIILLSYLSGSIPTAVIVSKLFFGFDIRKKGSGNSGSTNAFRMLGAKWGIFVQIVDILKGVLPVAIIAPWLGSGIELGSGDWFEHQTVVQMIAGVAAVVGHIWSVFVGFKGGKGVNTTAGILLALAPIDVAIGISVFILAVICSGYISLGSIVGSLTLPSSMILRYNVFGIDIPGYHILVIFTSLIAGLLVFTHRSNIVRLAKGTENKFAKLQLIKFRKRK